MGKSRQGRAGGGGERVRSDPIVRVTKGGARAKLRNQAKGSGSRRTKGNGSANRRTPDRQQNQQAQEAFQPRDPFWDPWDVLLFDEAGFHHPPGTDDANPGQEDQEAEGRPQGRDPFFDEW